jgi:hypothetical protein
VYACRSPWVPPIVTIGPFFKSVERTHELRLAVSGARVWGEDG